MRNIYVTEVPFSVSTHETKLAEIVEIISDNLSLISVSLFRLFETYPDTMGAFGPFKSIKPEDVRFNEELRDHGLRVINTVQEVLNHQ